MCLKFVKDFPSPLVDQDVMTNSLDILNFITNKQVSESDKKPFILQSPVTLSSILMQLGIFMKKTEQPAAESLEIAKKDQSIVRRLCRLVQILSKAKDRGII